MIFKKCISISNKFTFSYSIYLHYFQSTVNIIFDRVGRKDPVTRGLEIAVHWCGFNIDLAFWNQHISFLLVGCIVVTSIRGLLLTLTKVSIIIHSMSKMQYERIIFCSFSIGYHRVNPPTSLC